MFGCNCEAWQSSAVTRHHKEHLDPGYSWDGFLHPFGGECVHLASNKSKNF